MQGILAEVLLAAVNASRIAPIALDDSPVGGAGVLIVVPIVVLVDKNSVTTSASGGTQSVQDIPRCHCRDPRSPNGYCRHGPVCPSSCGREDCQTADAHVRRMQLATNLASCPAFNWSRLRSWHARSHVQSSVRRRRDGIRRPERAVRDVGRSKVCDEHDRCRRQTIQQRRLRMLPQESSADETEKRSARAAHRRP